MSANRGGSQLRMSAVGVSPAKRSRSMNSSGVSTAPRAPRPATIRRSALERAHLRHRLLTATDHVVIEAGGFVAPVDDLARHRGPDAAPAHEQAAHDKIGDSTPDGRAGQVETVGEGEFVLEGVPGPSRPLSIAAVSCSASW